MNKILVGIIGFGLMVTSYCDYAGARGYATKTMSVGKSTYSGTQALQVSGNAKISGQVSANTGLIIGTITANKFVGDGSGLTNVSTSTGNITLTGNITAVNGTFSGTVSANQIGTAWTSFTPTCDVVTWDSVSGFYRRVGKTVYVKTRMYSVNKAGGAGDTSTMLIGGLPYVVASPTGFAALGTAYFITANASNTTQMKTAMVMFMNNTTSYKVQILYGLNALGVRTNELSAATYRELYLNFSYDTN